MLLLTVAGETMLLLDWDGDTVVVPFDVLKMFSAVFIEGRCCLAADVGGGGGTGTDMIGFSEG